MDLGLLVRLGLAGQPYTMPVVLLLPFVAELGLQPFLFMERAVTTPDLFNNLSGACAGIICGLMVGRLATRAVRSSGGIDQTPVAR